MSLRDVFAAVLVAVIWGVAFVVTRIGLDTFSPPQLTAARFLVAAVPAVFLARPPVPWSVLAAIGLTLFAGQFLLQFFGIALGMPPGLASIVVQTQALFTILLAALVLRERPGRRQLIGIAVAGAGLGVIGLTVGRDVTAVGFALTALAAVSWGIGNVLVKRLPRVDVLSLVVWLSLVPPLPSLALALALDGPGGLVPPAAAWSWTGLGAALYLGLVATVAAYAVWGRLLRRYPAATVAPFALLVPFVAAVTSWLALGERFGALRLAGMALVLLGLAVLVVPLGGARRRRGAAAGAGGGGLVPRPATRADAPGVIALIGRVYAEYGFVYDPAVEVPDLLRFDAHYGEPRGAFFVVRHGPTVVGSVGVEQLDGAVAELHRLYLDTPFRGQGTGRALVDAVIAWCRSRGVRRLILWSDTRFERAHVLYQRMGFQRGGERVVPGDVNDTREYRFERALEPGGPAGPAQ